jgi:hypothetical protein
LQDATTAMQDATCCALQGEHRSNPAFRILDASNSSNSPTNRSFELARLMLLGGPDASRCRRERVHVLSNALIRIPAPDHGPQQVDLIYVPSLGDFRRYETRLLAVVGRFREHIRFTKARAGELSRFTGEHVFVSKTVPNVVLVRRGEVVAHAVGDLPATELEAVVRAAIGRGVASR